MTIFSTEELGCPLELPMHKPGFGAVPTKEAKQSSTDDMELQAMTPTSWKHQKKTNLKSQASS